MGNEVRRYTESPTLAFRVEMPFSSTTATRVPLGTRMDFPLEGAAAGISWGRGSGVGAEVCGPASCWPAATETKTSAQVANNANLTYAERFMASPCVDAMRTD